MGSSRVSALDVLGEAGSSFENHGLNEGATALFPFLPAMLAPVAKAARFEVPRVF